MEAFRARQRALASLPQRELLERVLHGLDDLDRELGTAGGERRAAMLGAVDRLAERARDRRRESEWLRESLAAERAATHEAQRALAHAERAQGVLAAERDWLRETQAEALSERDWLRTTLAALERQRDWLEALNTATAAERDWLRSTLESERQRASWLEQGARAGAAELEWLRSLQAELAAERDWLRASLAGLEQERDWRRSSAAAQAEAGAAAVAQLEGELARLREHATAMARHERWLRGECAALIAELGGPARDGLPEPGELAPALDAARQRVVRLTQELAWRRSEMARARADGGAAFKRLLERSALGRRMRGWNATDGGPA
jgi:chromosome segregation ATPase